MPVISVQNNSDNGPVLHVVDFEATACAAVYSTSPDANFNHQFVVSDTKTTLLNWDLSSIPHDASISKAEFRFNHYYQTTAGRPVGLALITEAWNPATLTFNNQPALVPATPDAGGSSAQAIDVPYGIKTWGDYSNGFEAILGGALPWPWRGIAVARTAGYPYNGETYYTPDNGDAGYRPTLHIEYTV